MAPEDFKRKLTAVFSADAVGYSRLMGEDEAATVKTLESYKQVMFSLIKQHRGRVIDSPGDNLLAEFASVVDAVQCGVAVQKELQSRNSDLPKNRKMEFRIGINLGDVIEEGDRIYGDGVNIAARLESLADPGGICVSKTAFDQIESKLPLGYEFIGDQEVKNIAKPVGAYRVLMDPRVTIADEKDEPSPISVWKRKRVMAAAFAVLIIIIGAAVWNFYFSSPPIEPASKDKMAFPLPEKPSVAVLPFTNMSEDARWGYFADGITENIISALAQVPNLFVIARNSTFTYKGRPVKVQQVAEELGVRYVLEGSVQKSGDTLRVTAQLIDAINGHHIWSERYDRQLKEIFALQDDIALKVINALQVKLTEGEQARLIIKDTENLEAYLKYIQAREIFFRVTRDGNIKARGILDEVIALDPHFAAAYGLMGSIYLMDVTLGISKSPADALKRALELIKKAIAMDDKNAGFHSLLGWLFILNERRYDKAIAECEKAIALAPNSAVSQVFMGIILTFDGKPEQGIPHLEKGLRLDPIPPGWYYRNLGMAYFTAHRYEDAIAACKKALNRTPNDLLTHAILTSSYTWAGREEEARSQAAEVLRINPGFSLEKRAKILKYKNQADRDRFLEGLRKAGLPEKIPLPLPDKPSIAVLPFVNMSSDPELEYVSDGISEEIITALSKTSKLFVIARPSSFKYKGEKTDVRKVGRELGVHYVLEGSVRRSGGRLRVTAQLIDTRTGNHLWGQRYDRDLKEIFALQDEITMKIIISLRVKLTDGEQARLATRNFKNLDVYLKAIEALSLWGEGTQESLMRFGQLGREIINMAPDSEAGYCILAWHYWYMGMMGKKTKESLSKAFGLAQKALSIDASDPDAYRLLGMMYVYMRQYEKAIAAGKKALELCPGGAGVHAALGIILNFAGKPDEAIAHLKEGIRLNPFPQYWYYYRLGQAYIQKGKYEKALIEYNKALKCSPNELFTHVNLAVVHSLLGHQEEASNEAKKVFDLNPDFSIEKTAKVLPYKNKDQVKLFVEAMRKAGLK